MGSLLPPIPQFLKALFDTFPLLKYPADPLPSRCPRPGPVPTLYVFSTHEDAEAGRPSSEPRCLKWQTYMKFAGIEIRLVPSTNHASPSGTLPFLISYEGGGGCTVVPNGRLAEWVRKGRGGEEGVGGDSPKAKAFEALVEGQIRDAWLYAVYLSQGDKQSPLLPPPNRSSPHHHLLSSILTHQTLSAARAHLLHSRPGGVIDATDIYADAASAFAAISVTLGDDEWFWGAPAPGPFDAEVFAYCHLILKMQPEEGSLRNCVCKWTNLVAFERRVREMWFP